MREFSVYFDNSLELVYTLNDCPVIEHWAELIQARTVNELCPNNHVSGIDDPQIIKQKVERVYELIEIINLYSPRKIEKREITASSWKDAISVMHVHFPELKNDDNYKVIHDSLTEYNDLIHGLEAIFLARETKKSNLFRITLDFNKTVSKFYELPDDAYSYCEHFVTFGDLALHYTHVGRHAYEQFVVNDIECPKDQFVPQRTYNASVRLSFNNFCADKFTSKQNMVENWCKFYIDKGGKDYWGYDINDKKIQFGPIKIGKLTGVYNNNKVIDLSDQTTIVELLKENKIQSWKIKGA